MKRSIAVALIRGWQSDTQMFRFSADVLEAVGIREHTHEAKTPIRAFIAQRSRQASEFCWDSKFVSAVNHLVAHGVGSAETNKYKTQAVGNVKKIEVALSMNKQRNGEQWDAHKRSNQWAVCK